MDKMVSIALFFVVACMAVQGVASQKGIDLILLMDSTDNARSTNFMEERKFALAIQEMMGSLETRIGLYTFGESAFSQFMLNTYSDFTMMRQAIQYMWYSTGDGGVDQPINFTVSDAFQPSYGDRDCYPNVLIILTHKAIQDTSARSLQTTLREKNVKAIVLNMAGSAARNGFSTLTGNATLVLDIADWSALQTSVDAVLRIVHILQTNTGCGYLTSWDEWTGCSSTCGNGQRSRTRECVKNSPSDMDCSGELLDIKVCKRNPCVDPVDGSWAFWGTWGTCTKTCNNGTQQRTRQCSQPAPANGGKFCPGKNTQTRNCAEFKCPDCNKQCPPGGRISDNCETCVCSLLTLYGQVMDRSNDVVQGASIFLESSMYKPLATTGSLGRFVINGVCVMNEKVFISSARHVNRLIELRYVNSTHWTLVDATLQRLVQPIFTIQPEDKIRMVGQSLSLCCSATGFPKPSTYTWLKDKVELEAGTNGTLFLSSLQQADSGTYTCSTETEAGVSQTQEAHVRVLERAHDTCGPPEQKLQDLPAGCYMTGDATRSTTIDVGTCGNAACMKTALSDNGSCSDYWPHHCCAEKDVRDVDISCDGFSYKLSIIRTCECKICIYKTVISGRAFGMKDGTEYPLKLGEVLVEGQIVARTSMSGFFKFEVPKGIKRVVATFHDGFLKTLNDITKIISVDEGKETYATISIPLRPVPIPFETTNGTEILLGHADNKPPAAKMTIPPNSVITMDGQPYKGNVQASIHFMDPRSMEDIESANGEFNAELPNGESRSLKTYGMFSIDFEDSNGSQLTVNKPMKYSFNSSLFNIPLDEHGNPDSSIWTYDMNKGTWVELAKIVREDEGRIKRATSFVNYVANVTLDNLPPLVHINRTTTVTQQAVRRRILPYLNSDAWVTEYINVTQTGEEVKSGSCFMAVSVYSDMSLKAPYAAGSIQIKTYVKDATGTSFESANTVLSLKNGRACVPIFCNREIHLRVLHGSNEQLFAGNHYLPFRNYVTRTEKSSLVVFTSNDIGVEANKNALMARGNLDNNTIFAGPIFQYKDASKCRALSALDKSFQFKFAPFTKAPLSNYVNANDNNKKLSWYPLSPTERTFKTCFIKVSLKITLTKTYKFKRLHLLVNGRWIDLYSLQNTTSNYKDIQETFDLRLLAISQLTTLSTKEQYGSYEAGPLADPAAADMTTRTSCLEYRCAGLVHDGGVQRRDLPTVVSVYLNTKNSSMKCIIENAIYGLVLKPITSTNGGVKGFEFTAQAGNNYGDKFGVFMSNNPPSETEKMCYSGYSYSPDGKVNPSVNPAVLLNCL